jgi:hypothetical protein
LASRLFEDGVRGLDTSTHGVPYVRTYPGAPPDPPPRRGTGAEALVTRTRRTIRTRTAARAALGRQRQKQNQRGGRRGPPLVVGGRVDSRSAVDRETEGSLDEPSHAPAR